MQRGSVAKVLLGSVILGSLMGSAAYAQGSSIIVGSSGPMPLKHAPNCGHKTDLVVGFAACDSYIRVNDDGSAATSTTPTGFGPSDLRSAYNISGNGSSNTTIAIVDAYGYPRAAVDLATYRKTYGLPACTARNGCFTKVDENGGTSYPKFNSSWSIETALDLQMASAMCPSCKILLVEAASSSYQDLATAENTAASLGAHVISNSYGGSESGTQSYEANYNHPGVAVTASSGDSGYGPQFPASSPHVTAVGGTSLTADSSTARGWSETAWSGAGSGCSTVYPKPSWQTDTGCANRTIADVSAVADPDTGVAVYAPTSITKSAWYVVGGTSVAAPLIAGIYGLNGGAVNYGSDPYAHLADLNDVTSGSNGSCSPSYLCTAGPGYDGPTGNGTPNGIGAFGTN